MLLVTSEGCKNRMYPPRLAVPDLLAQVLQASNVECVKLEIRGDATVAAIDEGLELGRRARCDAVVACGGGGVLDTGKVVAAMLSSTGTLAECIRSGGALGVGKRRTSMVGIPTTVSSAWSSSAAVVLVPEGDEWHNWIVPHERLAPDRVLVDPDLIRYESGSVLAVAAELADAYLRVDEFGGDPRCVEGLGATFRWLRETRRGDGASAQIQTDLAEAVHLAGELTSAGGLGPIAQAALATGASFYLPYAQLSASLWRGAALEHVAHIASVTEGDAPAAGGDKAAALGRYDDLGKVLGEHYGGGVGGGDATEDAGDAESSTAERAGDTMDTAAYDDGTPLGAARSYAHDVKELIDTLEVPSVVSMGMHKEDGATLAAALVEPGTGPLAIPKGGNAWAKSATDTWITDAALLRMLSHEEQV